MKEAHKCAVCWKVFPNDAMVCRNRHNTCDACYVRLNGENRYKCPTCRTDMRPQQRIRVDQRLFGNEWLRLRLPCIYEEVGCTHQIRRQDYTDHVERCQHQTVPCPITTSTCAWSGKPHEVVEHLQNDHKKIPFINRGNVCLHLSTKIPIYEWYAVIVRRGYLLIFHAQVTRLRFELWLQSHLLPTSNDRIPRVKFELVSSANNSKRLIINK